MNIYNKKIGIWGFGIVGKSVAHFLHRHHIHVQVMDRRLLTDQETTFLNERSIRYVNEQHRDQFFSEHDFIVVSAGIDLRPYTHFHYKCITELDLFSHFFSKPIIAITGTIGKTTLTTLLSNLLSSQGMHIATGGNIGLGLCDLIEHQHEIDYAVLEVSSFQLELSQTFAPDLAIWTNFHPNHLDRHSTLHDYFLAKTNIIRFQKTHQKALLPVEIIPTLTTINTVSENSSFFSCTKPSKELFEQFSRHAFFWIENDSVMTNNKSEIVKLGSLDQLPAELFTDTKLIIIATCSMLNISNTLLSKTIETKPSIEHRLEKVATFNGVTFYNDSKATVPQATSAAINTLQSGSILLLLGGLSKGIDRKPFVEQLKNKTSYIFCFGAEANQLHQWCAEYTIPASAFSTLEEAFQACLKHAQSGDTILLSPGGSSFDLFENYQQRGERFKQLVKKNTIP